MNMINSIKIEEGFSGLPYDDTEGILTIGYGTKLPLTEIEGEMLLRHRLSIIEASLSTRQPIYNTLPEEAKEVLLSMAYQLGVNGVLKFKRMWKNLKNYDYEAAAYEMLDSKWAIQTPNRANRLADRMRNVV